MTTNSIRTMASEIPFKIVGLIASVVTILACFVGGVMWISISMADNAVRIESMERDHVKYESLIEKNSDILAQHGRLLVILEHHGKRLEILSNFMTQGGRFTADDGRNLNKKIDLLEKSTQRYEILERELEWIKKSIGRLDDGLTRRLNVLGGKIDDINKNDGSKTGGK